MKKATLSLALTLGAALQAAEKPNIILIFVDDMGWGDLGYYQKQELKRKGQRILTPSLDRMAAQGVQLRRHYTAAPVSAPARASLFSGLTQGHAEVVRNNNFDAPLEDGHTLPSVLQAAGYSTALVGKWGIGGGAESTSNPKKCSAWPTKRGFDYFFGVVDHLGAHRHYPFEEPFSDKPNQCNAIWDGETIITPKLAGCYSTDLFTARAKKWIVDEKKQNPDKPFFMALCLTAPHARLSIPAAPYPRGGGLKGGVQWLENDPKERQINTAAPKTWDTYINPAYEKQKKWPEFAKRHASMITRVDNAVGDIMQLCRDLKIDKNTYIIFSSDNGSHNEAGGVPSPGAGHPCPAYNPSFFQSYGKHDGIKRDILEGGLRVPTLVYAPGKLKPLVVTSPNQFQDWMPTMASIAGVAAPARSNGSNLMPVLQGKDKKGSSHVYTEYNYPGKTPKYKSFADKNKAATRGEQQAFYFWHESKGWLKAIRRGIQTAKTDFEVFDTLKDPQEEENLAGKLGDAAALQSKLQALALQQRRAYKYRNDPKQGNRGGLSGKRVYDSALVPSSEIADATQLKTGLQMRQVQATSPWVPAFDSLPQAKGATTSPVADLKKLELPAGSITELKGYVKIPADSHKVRFGIKLDKAEGSKAYVKLHRMNLIDADKHYEPGTLRWSNPCVNARTGLTLSGDETSVPLAAGWHELTITIVQSPDKAGKLHFTRSIGGSPDKPVPAGDLGYAP